MAITPKTREPLPYAAHQRPDRPRRWLRRIVWTAAIVLLSLTIFMVVALGLDRAAPAAQPAVVKPADLGISVSAAPPAAPEAPEPLLMPPPPRFDVAKVQASSVRPHLEALRVENAAARSRAQARVRSHFRQADAGAAKFAAAVIGPLDAVKTLYLAGKGGIRRWRHKDRRLDPLRDHVAWNYQEHVTSGAKIEAVVRHALVQFESDLRANRNRAVQSITQDLAAEELAVTIAIDREKLAAACDAEVRAAVAQLMSDRVAERAAVASIGTEIAANGLGAASAYAGRLIVLRLVAVPVSGAVGGTSIGASLGSFAPGIGNAAGAVTGLLVGITVDLCITHRQTVKVTDSVRRTLATAEHSLMNGHDGAAGLRRIFDHALTVQNEAIDRLIADELYAAAAPAVAHGSGS